MADLTVPTIHTNGTDGGMLGDSYVAARCKVMDAIEALRLTAPHGRDYYVQKDGGALSKATSQHWARIAALETVSHELEILALAVATQCDERRK